MRPRAEAIGGAKSRRDLLAIDTVCGAASAAVWRGGRIVGFAQDADDAASRAQAERLTAVARAACSDAGDVVFGPGSSLAEIAVGVGPGGFTAARVGVAFARGLGLALGATVRGVTAPAMWAVAAGEAGAFAAGGAVVVALDVGRGRRCCAAFTGRAGRCGDRGESDESRESRESRESGGGRITPGPIASAPIDAPLDDAFLALAASGGESVAVVGPLAGALARGPAASKGLIAWEISPPDARAVARAAAFGLTVAPSPVYQRAADARAAASPVTVVD